MADSVMRVIDFIMDHNETVVQTMVVLVVAWGAFILGTWVLGKTSEQAEVTEGAAAAAGTALNASVAAEAALQVAKLQAELNTRTQEIEALKVKSEVTGSVEAVDVSGYERKIKDLEGKLSEYEILEDDIADLSLYKEENARLKAELQRMGGDSGGTDAAPVETAPAPTAEGAKKSEAIVQQFTAVVEQSQPSGPEKDGDDLLTEFAASTSDADAGGVEDAGGLDTDKMMAEMASLEGVEGDGTSSLEGESDMDKMAAEASKLLGS